MIVDSPAALKLMAALADLGAAGGSRQYLMRKADISTSTFYRLIGPLIENGLVQVEGPTYLMAFSSPYCFRFKLWHDMERLYDLSPGIATPCSRSPQRSSPNSVLEPFAPSGWSVREHATNSPRIVTLIFYWSLKASGPRFRVDLIGDKSPSFR